MTLKEYNKLSDYEAVDYEAVMLWWEYNAAHDSDISFDEFNNIMRDSLTE